MLKFVLGRSGYGKTEYCMTAIKNLVDGGAQNVVLITPEQYNFTAEKKLLTNLGEANINRVELTSFSRLSYSVKSLYGGDSLPTLSAGAKGVMMKKAVESVKDELLVFTKKVNRSSFINSMVGIYDEMKSCDISAEKMLLTADVVESTVLKGKLHDMGLIIEAYEKLIDGRYFDSAEELKRLHERLQGSDYFNGREVFIDGFNGFVANEYKVLEDVIEGAKNVTITFSTDSYENYNSVNVFAYVNKSIGILEKQAKKRGIPVSFEQLTENHRTDVTILRHAEQNLYEMTPEPFYGLQGVISVYSAVSVYDECTRVASEIKKDLRRGVRAREIAVITRDMGVYNAELMSAFKKFGIPYFNDERQPIKAQPVVIFVQYLLRTAIYSFRSDDILSLAKTGLTDLDGDSINALENYTYIWEINGYKKWSEEFKSSTKGIVEKISDDDRLAIDAVNETRQFLFEKLDEFKKRVHNASAMNISRAVYYALQSFNVPKNLLNIANDLQNSNHAVLAEEQGRVWDVLMEVLNKLAIILSDEKVTLEEYLTYFNIEISAEDLGVLPQGIDNVQIGSADRIRTDNPKVVYVIGANENEFPKAVESRGLLTESDRIILSNNDFKLYSYAEILNCQERYFAYMATSAPSEKLHVSYINTSDKGPSSIVTSILDVFPNTNVENRINVEPINWVESESYAFEYMTEHYGDNTEFEASLKEYFKDDEKFKAVDSLVKNDAKKINNTALATELFGKNMMMSASRLETFFNCPFKYFCNYGISVKPRRKVKLDALQSGTVVHFVLERMLTDYNKNALFGLKSDQIRISVNKYLLEYLHTKIDENTAVSKRFTYQFMRLSNMIVSVVTHLIEELKQSQFEPKAFELQIDYNSEVKPQKITLDDGGVITVKGIVDRLDVCKKNGKQYIRVVDYKTGTKKFNLNDVLYGLNLQMFVYLFTIWRDKGNKYSGIPAGVLYMHASNDVLKVEDAKAGENEIKKAEDDRFKMEGIVLYDDKNDILDCMEDGVHGKYIPAKRSTKGVVSGNIVTLEQLGQLARKVDELVAFSGNSLHEGKIDQNPIQQPTDHEDRAQCKYCDYNSICANRKEITTRNVEKRSNDDVLSIIGEEAQNA